eukprot:gene13456-13571_t
MLQITHKEESGFHYLQSLITFYGKGDQVEVAANNAFSLTVKGEFGKDLPIEGNLVLKAAEWLGGLYPDQSKASVTLSKNLPLSSGIGGGSSDAAATIAALLDLWGIDLNYSEKINLIKASAILGADIPVCLAYHLLGQNFFWIDGTGKEGKPEALWEEDFKEIYLLLVNPGIAVSTPSFKSIKSNTQLPFSPNVWKRSHLFWALKEISIQKGISVPALIGKIDMDSVNAEGVNPRNLSSRIR